MSRRGETPQDAAIGGGGGGVAPKKNKSKQSKKNKTAKKNESKTANASTLSAHDEVLKTADHLDMLKIKEVVDTVSEIAAGVAPTGQKEAETKVEKKDSAAGSNKPMSVGAAKSKNRKRRNRKTTKSAKEIPSDAVPMTEPDRKEPEKLEPSASEPKPNVLSYSQVLKPLDARAPEVPTATVSELRAVTSPTTQRQYEDYTSSDNDYEYYVDDDSGEEWWNQDQRRYMDGTGY